MNHACHAIKTLRTMVCATLLLAAALASVSSFAEPPPYGPDADPWGGCVDMDTNGTGGLVTVICPTKIAPNTPANSPVVGRAKSVCLTRTDGTFGEIKGQYLCLFPSKTQVRRPSASKAQFSAADWQQFRHLGGSIRSVYTCPPHNCEEFLKGGPIKASPTNPPSPDAKSQVGPVKPAPTNPPPPAASARPCPAYKGDPCGGTPGQI